MSHHIDPVCGKRLNVNKAHIVVTYQEVKYYLCCPQCQKEFEQNPTKYIHSEKKRGK